MESTRILAVAILCSFLLVGCVAAPGNNAAKGTLSGTVSIGPLCPTQSAPPSPNCIPTQATFDAYPIGVWDVSTGIEIAKLQPDASGKYSIDLVAGSYKIDLEKPTHFGGNLPATIQVASGQNTSLDINIDTGIR